MGIVAVTGANGFIGRNLGLRLSETGHVVRPVPHDLGVEALTSLLADVDFVVHLAGVNRPDREEDYFIGNVGMTERLLAALTVAGNAAPVIQASSTQAERDNSYGRSKRMAEDLVRAHGERTRRPAMIWRLTNVFGKWCRPNYNSVVATFCHNIARGLDITISDPRAVLHLVYVDDVVNAILDVIDGKSGDWSSCPAPVYETTLQGLADQIRALRDSRATLMPGAVGKGFLRALHATYLSHLDPADFAYPLVAHEDLRGAFSEVLRTADSGQFSFFTAYPGITRGGHYHHSKTEKFLVVQGRALFRFRHMITGEYHELETDHVQPRVVETVPGWSHDITNIGEGTMIVMLWANEVFDREKPDTIAAEVKPR